MRPQSSFPAFDPHTIRLIVYDLDGTLVDAFEDIHAALNASLAEQGLPGHSLETVKSFVGDGVAMLAQRALPPGSMDLHGAVLNGVVRRFAAQPVGSVKLYPNALETLRDFKTRGILQAVLTNKLHDVAQSVCAALGVGAIADGVWGEEPGIPRKPDAASLERILKYFDIPAQACLMVGDGPADRDVARAVGAWFAGATWGAQAPAVVAAWQPDALVDSLPALLALFN